MNKCVFEKLVSYKNVVITTVAHILAEVREDDTRHAQGRDACSPTNTQYLCESLSFVHIVVTG